ncbi:MAG: PD-(D/E)XK nuclease family protein [Eubacteriales bacterium]|nr:PD-(D/E)XK nuclease family protein [Eubacteriales bacterium]
MMRIFTAKAGTGASEEILKRYIADAMEEPAVRHYIVVPEQYSQVMEEQLLDLHPRHAYMNPEVITIRRLARLILEETDQEMFLLSEMEQELLLRKVLLKHNADFTLFRGRYRSNGFTEELSRFLSDYFKSGLDTTAIRDMSPTVHLPLRTARKLADVATVLKAFAEEAGPRHIVMSSLAGHAARFVSQWTDCADARFLWMGHTVFDTDQYRLIGALLEQAREMDFCLALPQVIPDGADFYLPLRETLNQLEKTAETHHVRSERINVTAGARSASALRFCNEQLFVHLPAVYSEKPEGLSVFVMRNPQAELDRACRRIQYLVRREGYRYRDFAVICGSLAENEARLYRTFKEYGIPFYFDRKKALKTSPLIRFLRAMLAIIEYGPKRNHVIALIKSGMVFSDVNDAALAENYILAAGCNSYKAYEEWTASEDLRIPIAAVLNAIRQMRRAEHTCAEALTMCRELLTNLSAEERLTQFADMAAADGDMATAGQYRQLYRHIDEVMTVIERIFGATTTDTAPLWRILSAAVADVRLGTVPEGMDEVFIGDITRSMPQEKRYAFFLFANEDRFIDAGGEPALFNEEERIMLRECDIVLDENGTDNERLNRLKFHLLFARITERAEFSYSVAGYKGEAFNPDRSVETLRKIFPDLSWTVDPKSDRDVPATATAVLSEAVRSLSGRPDYFLPLLRLAAEIPAAAEPARILAAGRRRKGSVRKLSTDSVKSLYQKELSMSVSRLERYNECPFHYFAAYNLHLQPRPEAVIRPLDIGNLAHEVAEHYFRKFLGPGVQLPEESGAIARVVDEIMETRLHPAAVFSLNARNDYRLRQLKRIIINSLTVFSRQLNAGDFHIGAVEWPFEFQTKTVGHTVHFRGKVDRMDLLRTDKATYCRIVDYKTGSRRPNATAIASGLMMQLPVYTAAVAEREGHAPAGMHYLRLDEPWMKSDRTDTTDAPIGPAENKEMRLCGPVRNEPEIVAGYDRRVSPDKAKDSTVFEAGGNLVSGAVFEGIMEYAKEKIETTTKEILRGRIDVLPCAKGQRLPCEYCDFNGICGFDEQIGDYHRREPEEVASYDDLTEGTEHEVE